MRVNWKMYYDQALTMSRDQVEAGMSDQSNDFWRLVNEEIQHLTGFFKNDQVDGKPIYDAHSYTAPLDFAGSLAKVMEQKGWGNTTLDEVQALADEIERIYKQHNLTQILGDLTALRNRGGVKWVDNTITPTKSLSDWRQWASQSYRDLGQTIPRLEKVAGGDLDVIDAAISQVWKALVGVQQMQRDMLRLSDQEKDDPAFQHFLEHGGYDLWKDHIYFWGHTHNFKDLKKAIAGVRAEYEMLEGLLPLLPPDGSRSIKSTTPQNRMRGYMETAEKVDKMLQGLQTPYTALSSRDQLLVDKAKAELSDLLFWMRRDADLKEYTTYLSGALLELERIIDGEKNNGFIRVRSRLESFRKHVMNINYDPDLDEYVQGDNLFNSQDYVKKVIGYLGEALELLDFWGTFTQENVPVVQKAWDLLKKASDLMAEFDDTPIGQYVYTALGAINTYNTKGGRIDDVKDWIEKAIHALRNGGKSVEVWTAKVFADDPERYHGWAKHLYEDLRRIAGLYAESAPGTGKRGEMEMTMDKIVPKIAQLLEEISDVDAQPYVDTVESGLALWARQEGLEPIEILRDGMDQLRQILKRRRDGKSIKASYTSRTAAVVRDLRQAIEDEDQALAADVLHDLTIITQQMQREYPRMVEVLDDSVAWEDWDGEFDVLNEDILPPIVEWADKVRQEQI